MERSGEEMSLGVHRHCKHRARDRNDSKTRSQRSGLGKIHGKGEMDMSENSISELDNQLNQQVLQGDILGAFDRFYADDVVMQENSETPFSERRRIANGRRRSSPLWSSSTARRSSAPPSRATSASPNGRWTLHSKAAPGWCWRRLPCGVGKTARSPTSDFITPKAERSPAAGGPETRCGLAWNRSLIRRGVVSRCEPRSPNPGPCLRRRPWW